jgi:hypothetical protein
MHTSSGVPLGFYNHDSFFAGAQAGAQFGQLLGVDAFSDAIRDPGPASFAIAAISVVPGGLGTKQMHHIASNKNVAGGFTAQFERLFAKAGRNLDHPSNLMELSGHSGRHSKLYHQYVLDKLTTATDGLEGEDMVSALDNALNELRREIAKNPGIVRGRF